MNYTLHQLRIFAEVARQKSITKAAEQMHLTQPALSIQLKNFQNQFDVPLTEVIGRQLYITEFGRTIAQLAESTLREAEAIHYHTQAYEGLYAGTLRISSASTGKYVIPYFLSKFLDKYRGVDLVLDVTNKTQVVEALHHNQPDFALVSVLPSQLDLHEEILLDNELYLVAARPEIDANLPYIFREEGSATRAAMDDYLRSKELRKRIELTSNEAVKQAVIAGLGQSILPLIGIRNELEKGQLYIIPSPGLPIRTRWRLVWLKSKKLAPVAEAFLSFVRAGKSEVIEQHFGWIGTMQ